MIRYAAVKLDFPENVHFMVFIRLWHSSIESITVIF